MAMANSRRNTALTILAILFAILGLSDILKPLRLEGKGTALVFLGKQLSGAPNAILGSLLGIFLLAYAAGIWRMRRYAIAIGYGYAIYVTINVTLFSLRNTMPPSPGLRILGIVYVVFALALSWGTPTLLRRHQAELV
jgi:hypothetical protein